MTTSGQSRYATVNETNLHYVEWGSASAPPIVLCHGLRAYGHWFDDFAEVAKDRYRVIAQDLRGRGASEWAKDADYSTDAYVADLEGLVDHLGLSRFILGGHSLGGVIVAHYAARHPERVAALLILDMTPDVDPAGIQRIRGCNGGQRGCPIRRRYQKQDSDCEPLRHFEPCHWQDTASRIRSFPLPEPDSVDGA